MKRITTVVLAAALVMTVPVLAAGDDLAALQGSFNTRWRL